MALVLRGICTDAPSGATDRADVPRLTKDACLMPCQINHDGPAEVDKYFHPFVEEVKTDPQQALMAVFRGYPLQGQNLNLPDNYCLLVMQESQSKNVGEDRDAHQVHTFGEMTYWNWDKQPSNNDAMVKLLDWISIAEQIHSTEEMQ